MNDTRSILLAALLGVSIFAGNFSWWFQSQVADPEAFVASATVALSREESRDAIGELIAERLTAEVPILLIIESSLASLFSNLFATSSFGSVIGFVAEDVHGRIVTGDTGAVVVTIEQYRDDIMAPFEAIAPQLAALVPSSWFESVEILTAETLPDISRAAQVASPILFLAFLVAAMALVLLVRDKKGRNRATALVGGAFIFGGVMSGIFVPLGQRFGIGPTDSGQIDVLYLNIYNELTRSLWRSAAVLVLIGTVILMVAVVVHGPLRQSGEPPLPDRQ